MNVLLDNLAIDDLPNEGLKSLALKTSMDFVKELISKGSGLTVYIPQNYTKKMIRRYIKDNSDGRNIDKLAEKLGVSRRTVSRHLSIIAKQKTVT